MNYTANYHLPQWDETDRIMRTDFNQMCADVESGLTGNASAAAAAKARGDKGVSDAAAAHTAARNAQSTANTARTAANAAQSTADAALAKATAAFSTDNRPYVWGSYTATGQEQEFQLGFRPFFVIFWLTGDNDSARYTTHMVITQGLPDSRLAHITDTGFVVHKTDYPSTPGLNGNGSHVFYLAFR